MRANPARLLTPVPSNRVAAASTAVPASQSSSATGQLVLSSSGIGPPVSANSGISGNAICAPTTPHTDPSSTASATGPVCSHRAALPVVLAGTPVIRRLA